MNCFGTVRFPAPEQLPELGREIRRVISHGLSSALQQRRPDIQQRPGACTVKRQSDAADLTTHEESLNVISPGRDLAKPEQKCGSHFQREEDADHRGRACLPVSLWVGCLVRGRVLQLEFNQGNLGGSLIGKATTRLTTWIPSITPMRNKTSKKMRREAQPGTTCDIFYSDFRFM